MGNLLFSPKGRIGPNEFMKGLGVLALIGAIITVVPLFNYGLGQMLTLASIVLLFPLVCILIKRCHDAGKTGWMSILFLILIGIVGAVLQMVATNMTGGTEMAEMNAAIEELSTSGAGLSQILEATQQLTEEYGPAIAKNTAIPNAIAGFVGTMLGGFLTNLILKSDMDENQYGQPTA